LLYQISFDRRKRCYFSYQKAIKTPEELRLKEADRKRREAEESLPLQRKSIKMVA